MPALRSDSALIAFRRKLEALNYDMRAWRAQQVHPRATACCSHSTPPVHELSSTVISG